MHQVIEAPEAIGDSKNTKDGHAEISTIDINYFLLHHFTHHLIVDDLLCFQSALKCIKFFTELIQFQIRIFCFHNLVVFYLLFIFFNSSLILKSGTKTEKGNLLRYLE